MPHKYLQDLSEKKKCQWFFKKKNHKWIWNSSLKGLWKTRMLQRRHRGRQRCLLWGTSVRMRKFLTSYVMFSPKTWGEVASWVCGTQIYIARLSFNTKCSSSLLKCKNSSLTKSHLKTLLNLLKTLHLKGLGERLNTSQMRHSPGQL